MELRLPIPPEQLTRAERSILDFINTNTDAFLFLSIGQLAERLGLSEATLSRFARHVGCRDFKALKTLVLEQAAAGPGGKAGRHPAAVRPLFAPGLAGQPAGLPGNHRRPAGRSGI